MAYAFTLISANRSTGPIPVITSPASTCPETCPLHKAGCYAEQGPLSWVWAKLGRAEERWDETVSTLRAIPKGQLWRYGQAGDLPGKGIRIDRRRLLELARAAVGKPGLVYTHKPVMAEQYRLTAGMTRARFARVTAANRAAIREAAALGLRINISCETKRQADKALALGFSAVLVREASYQGTDSTPAGNVITACPQKVGKTHSCVTCKGLCARERSAIIAFPAHGPARRKASQHTLVELGMEVI